MGQRRELTMQIRIPGIPPCELRPVIHTYDHGKAIGVFDFTQLRQVLPDERHLESVRRAVVDYWAKEVKADVRDFRFLEKDQSFHSQFAERTYSRDEQDQVVATMPAGEKIWRTPAQLRRMRSIYLNDEANFRFGPDWHTGLSLPSLEGYTERPSGATLQEIPFRGSGELRSIQYPVLITKTNKNLPSTDPKSAYQVTEIREVSYTTRAFGATATSQPSVIIISDQVENRAIDLLAVAPQLAHRLQEEFGLGGFPSTTRFFLHYPDSVRDNNPERFIRAEFGYNPSRPDEAPRPYLHHSSREPGAIMARETIAALIGEENMHKRYPEPEHRSPNILAQRAFEVGLDPTL